MAGPKANLAQGWKIVNSAVHMGEHGDLGLFLRCVHERLEVTLPNRIKLRGYKYNMQKFLESTVN